MPAQNAAAFHQLHADFLLLPNAWDAASARLTQELGAKAIATSSAAVAWAHGFADGNYFPIAKLVTVIEEIARSVSVPITTDAEAGYSDDPKHVAENVVALIHAGAVGVNIEDGKAPHALHLRKIEAIREAATRAASISTSTRARMCICNNSCPWRRRSKRHCVAQPRSRTPAPAASSRRALSIRLKSRP